MSDAFVKNFNLKKLELTTVGGETINLRNILIEMNVYEDLWNNNTTCSLVLNDANNLIMNLPIFGFEMLDVEFETPDKESYAKTFRLVRITDRELVRERELAYTLHFATPEAVTNLKTRVSKSYKGKLISEMVSDLHNNWLSGGPITVEETKEQHHVIVPNIYPAHAINWLSTRAISSKQAGASYMYYEDKYGFNFVSLESCLEADSTKTYLFQIGNVRLDNEGHKEIDYETNLVAVENYSIDNHSDILENMHNGMYGNQLITHSHVDKKWTSYTFDYLQSFDSYKHLYASNPLYSQSGDLASPNSRLKLHSTGQDDYPFKPDQWIPMRVSQLQQLQNTRLTITVPGDSERTVGEIIEFHLPSPEPPVEKQQINDKYHAGRYLVQSVRHKIDMDKYLTTMELVKDSVKEQYP